jgi:hypothetical protein
VTAIFSQKSIKTKKKMKIWENTWVTESILIANFGAKSMGFFLLPVFLHSFEYFDSESNDQCVIN